MEVDWQALGAFGIYSMAAILCLLGFALSCLSLSGTWLVLGAAGLVAWSRWPAFPGPLTLLCFLCICIGVELAEAFAANWGVQRRGGSRAAGWAAFGGGLVGMVAGGFLLPLPIVGNLAGMLAGSFACAYLVERSRMRKSAHAAHIARGAVLGRVAVVFMKIAATLLMAALLGVGIALT